MSSSKSSTQRRAVKQGVDLDESRRRRESESVEIRKAKKEESIQKRRNLTGGHASDSPSLSGTPSVSNLANITNVIRQGSGDAQLEAVIQLRKLLSIEKNPPIQETIETGILPFLISLLGSPNTKVQFESAWAVTNIASGTSEQTIEVAKSGAVPAFIHLLGHSDPELREQAVWALGNIAGDCCQTRDYVIQNNILPPLLQILQGGQKQSMLRNATWTLSNLCRNKPQPNFQALSVALPTLVRLLHCDDSEILVDALWALSYLSDGEDSQIEAILSTGVASKIIELLGSAQTNIQTPALRVTGNIVTGSDKITQVMIDLKVLPAFMDLLQSTRKALRKETAWAISNITAGNREQTQAVIGANLIPHIVHLLSTGDFDVKKECAWAISNATTWKSRSQINYLVQQNAVKAMCDLMKTSDTKVLNVVLEFLENVLECGHQHANKTGVANPYCQTIEECEGLDHLEKLQEHKDNSIYVRSQKIIEKYFDAAEEEGENDAQSFNFTPSATPVGGFNL